MPNLNHSNRAHEKKSSPREIKKEPNTGYNRKARKENFNIEVDDEDSAVARLIAEGKHRKYGEQFSK